MAATKITVTKLKRNSASAVPATAAVDTSAGAELDLSGISDERLLIVLENAASAAKKATILKGNGIAGVADLEISVPATSKYCIVVESSKFKNVSGTNSGKMFIKGEDTNIKVAAVYLP